jgi:exopolysaccharide biosynthesis polyprenyl glycosylphosphotransferase
LPHQPSRNHIKYPPQNTFDKINEAIAMITPSEARIYLAPGGLARQEDPSIPSTSTRRLRFPFRGGSWVTAVAVGDFLVSAAALCLAWWLRFHTGLAQIGFPEPSSNNLATYAGHILLGSLVMSTGLLVQRAYSYQTILYRAHEIRVVFMAIVVWLATYLSLSLMLKFQPTVSRLFCVLAMACLLVSLSYWRLIVAHYIAPGHLSKSLRRRVLLVGWNKEIQHLANSIAHSRNREIELCGFLLPAGAALPTAPLPHDLQFLGSYDDLTNVIHGCSCDAVIVGDLDLPSAELTRIAAACEVELVDFELLATCFPVLRSGLSLRHIGGVPVLGVGALPLHCNFNLHLKRLLDIVGAIAGLILTAPILVLFGILIYRESPGPIVYRQRRIGVNGSPFTMLKLRSMHLSAEGGAKPGWTVKDDPRRLRIGKMMRKWNIDELPQLWNVLKGEMSLVGPRPERPEFVSDFKHDIPHYNSRHGVKPGMTGWAQVHGLRGDTDLADRVRHDLHYIENWNFWLDLQIIIMTVIKPTGGC